MYTCENTQSVSPHGEGSGEDYLVHVGTELEKKSQFLHFLQKELSAARTQTEKEAVASILLRTKLQIRALEKELRSYSDQGGRRKLPPQYLRISLRARRLQ